MAAAAYPQNHITADIGCWTELLNIAESEVGDEVEIAVLP